MDTPDVIETQPAPKTRAHAYIRVSTEQQNENLQVDAIRRYSDLYGLPLVVHRDKFTGATMDRPGWNKLEAAILAGLVDTLVVWRLDRLGRTASGLHRLFDLLQERGVKFVSIMEGLDLSTPAGKMMAGVIASMAEYERSIRAERVRAGQVAAKARGKKWGGSPKGWTMLTDKQIEMIQALKASGKSARAISMAMGINWSTANRFMKSGDVVPRKKRKGK
jgi:DNA invertase Pin-like site-specific DNA recombinase